MAQIIFQTDQSGANQNICSTAAANTVTFNFSIASNYEVSAASIVIKKGSATTVPVVVTIYDQPNGGGTAVGSSTVLASSVTQSFAPIEFLFTGVNLTAGISYSLVLSSTSSCAGSSPYSFKSGNFQVVDKTTAVVINTGYAIVSNMSALSTLTSSPKAARNALASPSSSFTLLGGADLTKEAMFAGEAECSVSAEMKIQSSASSAIECSTSLSAELFGAKSNFSVFAPLESSSSLVAVPSMDFSVSSDLINCYSSVNASVSLVASMMASMDMESILGAFLSGGRQKRKREGSGHYVLNSGAFRFRQWRMFTKASENHIPNKK